MLNNLFCLFSLIIKSILNLYSFCMQFSISFLLVAKRYLPLKCSKLSMSDLEPDTKFNVEKCLTSVKLNVFSKQDDF